MGINNINKIVKNILIESPYKFDRSQNYTIFNNEILLENGPLWTRYLSLNEEKEMCDELEMVLKLTKVSYYK